MGSSMLRKLTSHSEQMLNYFASVYFYMLNVEFLFNDDCMKPDVDEWFCTSANRSARITGGVVELVLLLRWEQH